MSPGGIAPRCAVCASLERHRAFRSVFDALRPALAGKSALQFSPDVSAPRDAFGRFEVSDYGVENSLDMSAIDRADNAYDVVIANHVMEHVENDRAAMAELDRIVRPTGFIFLSVPDLLRVDATHEYGRAREDKHGHWRVYGPDIALRWREAVPDWKGVGVIGIDPVTGEPDRATLLGRDGALLEGLTALIGAAGLQASDAFGPQPEVGAVSA
ncbi:methyltransferase domain-containing protein [Acuticoccus sp. MNP-M23]|uniref:methyltransferase domain-containing protein n=1 Tax=Acuticoccus sp. MNP-M23 TaxID=3072793 RepID=UPI002814A789|nr:methyltransferase domain-containing protein [Acuticoccus sp. MNP-M23]WMS44838.1 methyltransferase domain-containing protein [Acuticoccus sp. MNP-M23]